MQVNVHEAKTQLSRLLMQVADGAEVIIAKAGKPVARLVPYHQPPKARVAGLDSELVKISDDFDAPLPDELGEAFGI